MATRKQAHIDSVQSIKKDLLAVLEGMDYCIDWKQDDSEWSARELIYHVIDTPPGGVNNLVSGIYSGEVTEYDLWSDLTNLTPERLAYDLEQVTADIEAFIESLDGALSAMSEEDLHDKKVMMHQKTRNVDEERSINTILERTLNGHIREHLVQLQALREALAI
ncbi:MAG: hypothetical protein ABGX63_01805 [bacterium]